MMGIGLILHLKEEAISNRNRIYFFSASDVIQNLLSYAPDESEYESGIRSYYNEL